MFTDVVVREICDAAAKFWFLTAKALNLWTVITCSLSMAVCEPRQVGRRGEWGCKKAGGERRRTTELLSQHLTTGHYPRHLRRHTFQQCQQRYPHSRENVHLVHLFFWVWASCSRVPDLTKYLPFRTLVNSAVPSFLKEKIEVYLIWVIDNTRRNSKETKLRVISRS